MNKFTEILKKAGNGLLILAAIAFVLVTIYLGVDFLLKKSVFFSEIDKFKSSLK